MWVEWTLEHPVLIPTLESRLADMRKEFAAGEDWTFGIFDADETRVLGGAGLHPRGTTDRVELGYWLRTDSIGQGFAFEAAKALCAAAFRHSDVARVDVLCDVENRRSAAIPQRLGFTMTERFRQDVVTSRATERDTQRWTLLRSAFRA